MATPVSSGGLEYVESHADRVRTDGDTRASWNREVRSARTRHRRAQRSQAPSVSSDDARRALVSSTPSPSEDKPVQRARKRVEDTKDVHIDLGTDVAPFSACMGPMNTGANAFEPLPPLDSYVGSDNSSSQTSSYVNTPVTGSFGSSISGYQRHYEPCAGPSTFPHRHDWAYSCHGPTEQQQPVPVYQMANTSQARIVSTPLLLDEPMPYFEFAASLSQVNGGQALSVHGDNYMYAFGHGFPSMWREGECANAAANLHHMETFAANDMQLVEHEQPYHGGGGRSERLQGGEMPTPFQHHHPETHVPSVHSPPHIVRGFTGHAGGVGKSGHEHSQRWWTRLTVLRRRGSLDVSINLALDRLLRVSRFGISALASSFRWSSLGY